MGSSSSPLPKNQRGHNPASAAPAHIAAGIGVSATQKPPCHAAIPAQAMDTARKNATHRRSFRGLPSGLVGTCRNSSGSSSRSGGVLTPAYLRLGAVNRKREA